MNIGATEVYRVSNEYDIANILSHFDAEYIMHALEDKLSNISFANTLIEPNMVSAFENNFKLMMQQYPNDGDNIKVIREEVYRNIISMLCNKFNLDFNTVDDTIDIYTAAYYLYEFLVCNRNSIMINFFTAFIINNKDSLAAQFSMDDVRKSKDAMAAYSKRIYSDSKYIVISANILSVINYITNLDIQLINIFQSSYADYNLVMFLDNAFRDKGNFFKDFYCSTIRNPENAPIIITDIRLELQKIVGDTNPSHIDEIINSNE